MGLLDKLGVPAWQKHEGPLPKTGDVRHERRKEERANARAMKKLTAAKKNARVGISPRLRAMILERDGFACVKCGNVAQDGIKLHIGHIVPVCQGGTNDESNLQTECAECNLGTGGKRQKPIERNPARYDNVVEKLQEIVGKKKGAKP